MKARIEDMGCGESYWVAMPGPDMRINFYRSIMTRLQSKNIQTVDVNGKDQIIGVQFSKEVLLRSIKELANEIDL